MYMVIIALIALSWIRNIFWFVVYILTLTLVDRRKKTRKEKKDERWDRRMEERAKKKAEKKKKQ